MYEKSSPGERSIRKLRAAFELVHDVGRQIVGDHVDRSFAQLEPAHRVVGNHLDRDAVVARRRPASTAGKASSTTCSSTSKRTKRYGPVPTGCVRKESPDPYGTIGRSIHQLTGKRGERLGQGEHDRVGIGCGDRLQRPICALEGRLELGIEKRAERVDDVLRRELVAVMKANAAAQMCTTYVSGSGFSSCSARAGCTRRSSPNSSADRRSAARRAETPRRCPGEGRDGSAPCARRP